MSQPSTQPAVSLVTMVTDEKLLAEMHASATFEFEPIPVDANANGYNAAQALNDGVARASHDWIVIAHQDVLFPEGWWQRVWDARASLPSNHGPLGIFGVSPRGRYIGSIDDPHGRRRAGPLPAHAGCLDECVLVLSRDMYTHFDEDVPGFHMYGCDIVLENNERGHPAFVVDAPLKHLSAGTPDDSLRVAQEYVLNKWAARSHSVIPTLNGTLKASGGAGTFTRYAMTRLFGSYSYRTMQRGQIPT